MAAEAMNWPVSALISWLTTHISLLVAGSVAQILFQSDSDGAAVSCAAAGTDIAAIARAATAPKRRANEALVFTVVFPAWFGPSGANLTFESQLPQDARSNVKFKGSTRIR
jgi:hypothetical protein